VRSCLPQREHFSQFKDLAKWIGGHLRVESAVLDGEIACVDDLGRSVFNDLLFRRRACLLFAFDLLLLNGEDLRALPLIERKARLKRLLRRKPVSCALRRSHRSAWPTLLCLYS
jgi:bifunctional non-homologous end joining protein LigD